MAQYHDDPIEVEEVTSSKKLLTVALGVFAIAVGSTFAANINISSGGPSEFGQGIQVSTTCDPNIVVTPTATFSNAKTATIDSYTVESITVTDIAAACAGKSFKLNMYETSSAAPLNASPVTISFASSPTNGQSFNGTTWSGGTTDIRVLGGTLTAASIDTTGTGVDGRSGRTSITVVNVKNSSNLKVKSALVGRITMESAEYISIYALGDTGPGGGTIFLTPATLGNPTGKYFEYAPAYASTSTNPATGTYSGILDKTNTAGRAIGAGLANTNDITSKSTTGGAWDARNYSNNGYSDWFLPSNKELQAVCMYVRGILETRNASTDACSGGTLTGSWPYEIISSSTRGYDTYTWRGYFTSIGEGFNWQPGAVLPVRMFNAE